MTLPQPAATLVPARAPTTDVPGRMKSELAKLAPCKPTATSACCAAAEQGVWAGKSAGVGGSRLHAWPTLHPLQASSIPFHPFPCHPGRVTAPPTPDGVRKRLVVPHAAACGVLRAIGANKPPAGTGCQQFIQIEQLPHRHRAGLEQHAPLPPPHPLLRLLRLLRGLRPPPGAAAAAPVVSGQGVAANLLCSACGLAPGGLYCTCIPSQPAGVGLYRCPVPPVVLHAVLCRLPSPRRLLAVPVVAQQQRRKAARAVAAAAAQPARWGTGGLLCVGQVQSAHTHTRQPTDGPLSGSW